MKLEILAPGLLTTLQDRGRRGQSADGVGAAGAMDDVALRLANALVGNETGAAALEVTLRGPRIRCDGDVLVAVTGAAFDARCNGEIVPSWRPLLLRAGAVLDCGSARLGTRAYLAFGGGIGVDAVLGSRSTDVNSALGPAAGRPLEAGAVLPVAAAGRETAAALRRLGADASRGGSACASSRWSVDPGPWFEAGDDAWIALMRGTHFERLDAASRRALFDSPFRVGADSNRVGFRLEGPTLALAEPLELVSEGAAPGTVQLPPGGHPLVLMAEAPTTGGYPRIAHVAGVDLPRLAQCRPGGRVRFFETSLSDAQTRYLERERALAALIRSIRERLVS